MRLKTYRKIYYTNQLRVFELDTKYKTIAVRLITGEDIVDSGNVAILAQGQIDMNSLVEAFLETSNVYSNEYMLSLRLFRMSYSVTFKMTIFPPSLTQILHQFLGSYGFEIDDFVYLYRFIDIEDIWYLVVYCSSREFWSFYNAANSVLAFFTSMLNFRIILLV